MSFGSHSFGAASFGGAPEDFEAAFEVAQIIGGQTIIEVSSLVGETLIQYWHRQPEALRLIDRRKFEELVAELFAGFGYDVELTQQTRDGGKDIVALKRREVDVKFIIECKRPNPGKAVGVSAVRELHSVKMTEGATKAILATTTYFSPDAKLLFEKHRWELEPRDFGAIREWIADYLRLKGRLF